MTAQLYRSLERLHLAIKTCAGIGFEESSPTTNAHHASIWNDLNEAQVDAELKLKHFKAYPASLPQPRIRCSFCHKESGQVKWLISTPNDFDHCGYICEACVEVCVGDFGALLSAATDLLEWVPVCSKGSSGYTRTERLRAEVAKFGKGGSLNQAVGVAADREHPAKSDTGGEIANSNWTGERPRRLRIRTSV